MEGEKYIKRIADSLLQDLLEAAGAVVIEGAKWCGKTSTAEAAAKSALYLGDTDTLNQNKEMLGLRPRMFLNGEPPMLLDEWQEAPVLWDAVRFEVDHRNADGQFILTGSAAPDKEKLAQIHHTGTGRFAWLRMRPMSLWESGDSNGSVSLGRIFDGADDLAVKAPPTELAQIAYLMCRGGWPASLRKKSERAALQVAAEYYEAVARSDVSRVDGISKKPERVKRLMRSYARNQGAMSPLSTLLADIAANEADTLSENTVADYINALRMIFVVEDAPAWNPNLRSKTAIRSSDTRYFVDPSVATAALELAPGDLLTDLNTMGLIFETLAVRDLRCYADALGGNIYHYRDKTGLECDAVLRLRGGRYALIEIKLGSEQGIEEGAAALKKLADKIDTDKTKVPSFLMVVIAVGAFAYRRKDGVFVAPVRTLRP